VWLVGTFFEVALGGAKNRVWGFWGETVKTRLVQPLQVAESVSGRWGYAYKNRVGCVSLWLQVLQPGNWTVVESGSDRGEGGIEPVFIR
jgi:hypothetical protein